MPKITKAEAARILGKSERFVERQHGRGLTVFYEKGTTRDVPMYDEDEVRTLAEKRPAVIPAPAEMAIATRGDNAASQLSELVAILRSAGEADRRRDSPAVTVTDLAHKLTLSLAEAAQLAGLSRNHLREAITEGKLKARIIGRGWRVKRSDLDAYVKKL